MNFNSPIGYSKNPLIVRGQPKYRPSGSGDDCISSLPSSDSNCTMLSLPLEIIVQISCYLNQFDIMSLFLNHQIYQILKPKLYETIVVDCDWSGFTKEFESGITYIKSSYNLKHLIHKVRPHNPLHRDCRLIRKFVVKKLPDSLTFDKELDQNMVDFFGYLKLTQLTWVPDNFKFEFIENMTLSTIQYLHLNIRSNVYLNSIDFSMFSQLHNLQYLEIGPYNKSIIIRKILRQLPHLKQLKIHKHDKYLIEPISKKLLIRDLADLDYDLNEVNDINYIFKSPMSLTNLTLDGIILSAHDKLNINKDILTTLVLKVVEFNFGNGDSFLNNLYFPNLKQLYIDFRQGYQDFVPNFLGRHKLVKLDLTIRNNDTFQFNESNYAVINSITSLKHLSIEINHEKNLNWISKSLNLEKFQYFNNLSLYLCRFNTSNEETLRFLNIQKDLKMLQIFGLNAGGSPHFALSVLHPNVYDEWFKVQHVALIYARQSNLHYIKINYWIFECIHVEAEPQVVNQGLIGDIYLDGYGPQQGNDRGKGKQQTQGQGHGHEWEWEQVQEPVNKMVEPRDGIDDWFDGLARVK